jgi:hypothetical protein
LDKTGLGDLLIARDQRHIQPDGGSNDQPVKGIGERNAASLVHIKPVQDNDIETTVVLERAAPMFKALMQPEPSGLHEQHDFPEDDAWNDNDRLRRLSLEKDPVGSLSEPGFLIQDVINEAVSVGNVHQRLERFRITRSTRFFVER